MEIMKTLLVNISIVVLVIIFYDVSMFIFLPNEYAFHFDGYREDLQREALTFPPETRPLAWMFICAEMGPTGGAHDLETAHRGTDHRSTQGCPGRYWVPRAHVVLP